MKRLSCTDSRTRILNLFSRDTYVVDMILGRVIQNTVRTLATTTMILFVIGYSFPLFVSFIFHVRGTGAHVRCAAHRSPASCLVLHARDDVGDSAITPVQALLTLMNPATTWPPPAS